jgi:pimeloyl-ACP methyl ester carboxylesterase
MPFASTESGKLYFEETGTGHPVIFAHEFASDHRAWETQVRWFSRQYRCITFDAPGYVPSDEPKDEALYDYQHQVDNIAGVLRHLGIAKAHVVGLSMGAYAALLFGLRHPEMASALVIAGCGSGSPRAERARFVAECEAVVRRIEREGFEPVAREISLGPTRVQLQVKDPRGWEEFARHLAEHPSHGAANTLRAFQAARPSLEDFEAELAGMDVPVLLIVGDEDEPCLETNLYLKRTIPRAGLMVMPKTGHAVNLEEPALFNAAVQVFLAASEHGQWRRRDPRSKAGGVLTTGRS